jgi:hypothetical protein
VTDDLTALQTRMANWAQTTFGNADDWDYSTNITSAPNQSLVPIEVKRARYNYYYVVNSGDFGVHNPAYTRYILQVASDNLTTYGLPSISRQQIAKMSPAAKLAQIQANRDRARRADEASGGTP